eukprot:1661620-Prymnesium_polylepis.2
MRHISRADLKTRMRQNRRSHPPLFRIRTTTNDDQRRFGYLQSIFDANLARLKYLTEVDPIKDPGIMRVAFAKGSLTLKIVCGALGVNVDLPREWLPIARRARDRLMREGVGEEMDALLAASDKTTKGGRLRVVGQHEKADGVD